MALPGGWIADLFGYKDILNSIGALLPRRKAIRFIGASASDNAGLQVTDITVPPGITTFVTISDRDSYTGARSQGMLCYVTITQCYYSLQADLATWLFCDSNPGLGSQSDWYVDSTLGDDGASGLLGAPLASLNELSNRLCPFGRQMIVTRAVNINVTANGGVSSFSFSRFYLATRSADPTFSDFLVNINCSVQSTAPMAITSIVTEDGLTGTRGELRVGSGAFTAKERIRATTGSAADAMCYSTGLVSAIDTFTSTWCKPTFASFHSGLQPVAGDSVVVDTLTITINRTELYAGQGTRIVLNSAKLFQTLADGSDLDTGSTDSGGNVMYAGCQYVSSGPGKSTTTVGAYSCACRIISTARTAFLGQGWNIIALVVQGVLRIAGHADSEGICIDGGNLEIGTVDGALGEYRGALDVFSDFGLHHTAIQVCNGPGVLGTDYAAINVYQGSQMVVDGIGAIIWGASTSYPIGLQILSGGWAYVSQLTTISAAIKIPSTINVRAGGLDFAYSDTPIVIDADNCGLTTFIQIGSVASSSTINGYRYLTSQSANIAATILIASPAKGLHEFCGYIAVTTLDAAAVGTPVLNAIFTDDSGVPRTVPVATATPLTTLGGGGGVIPVEANGSSPIQFSVTGITAIGGSRFSVRIVDKLASAGP